MNPVGAPFSQLQFGSNLPSRSQFPDQTLLIFDLRLKKNPTFLRWSRKFKIQYAVTAGERLKDIQYFPRHAQNLLKLTQDFSPQKSQVVVVGGGSVGDFGGFMASLIKRGLPLVHIPSTWLAALDSSHGGKTALNVSGVKNQMGTFYSAQTVFLVKNLLASQPSLRAEEAFGELIKIALIDGGPWAKKLLAQPLAVNDTLWRHLPHAIHAKYKIVRKDPREQKGHRRLLNLGHTIGHVIEAFYHLPHGTAVHQGLQFAVDWSFNLGLMNEATYCKLQPNLPQTRLKPIPIRRFKQLLLRDKKRDTQGTLIFIFIRKPGTPIIKSVRVTELLAFAKKSGWAK